MSKTATQRGLTAIAAIVFLFLAIPASAETDLENRIQMLEQELKLIREQLQSGVKSAQESTTAPKKKDLAHCLVGQQVIDTTLMQMITQQLD